MYLFENSIPSIKNFGADVLFIKNNCNVQETVKYMDGLLIPGGFALLSKFVEDNKDKDFTQFLNLKPSEQKTYKEARTVLSI